MSLLNEKFAESDQRRARAKTPTIVPARNSSAPSKQKDYPVGCHPTDKGDAGINSDAKQVHTYHFGGTEHVFAKRCTSELPSSPDDCESLNPAGKIRRASANGRSNSFEEEHLCVGAGKTAGIVSGHVEHFVLDGNMLSNPPNASICQTIKEILPAFIMSLTSFSFGIMLGWPSPTYPVLLNLIPPSLQDNASLDIIDELNATTRNTFLMKTSHGVPIFNAPIGDPEVNPLPITLLQSPMIAGFLMFGMLLTTPYSSIQVHSARVGVLASLVVMLLGWILLWQATNLCHLLLSRFLIGMANGFALGQIKQAINAHVSLRWREFLLKFINIIFLSGILCAYVMGVFLDFHEFSLCAMGITASIYVLVLVLRDRPWGKVKNDVSIGICQLWCTKGQRQCAIIVCILTFVQQFVGIPATLVYCQFLMSSLGIPMPEIAAIGYISIYIFSYILGTFFFCRFNKKAMLLVSLCLTALSLIYVIVSIYLNLNPVIVLSALYTYIFVYGIGLGTVPNSILDILPLDQSFKSAASHFQLICFCTFAVVITKLYQVFYSAFLENYIFFILFLVVVLLGIIFVGCFIPSDRQRRQ